MKGSPYRPIPDVEAEIRRLRGSGMSWLQIGVAVDISENALRHWAVKNGMPTTTKPNVGPSLSPDKHPRLCELWLRNETVNAISIELKVSRGVVSGLVRRLKLPPRPSPIGKGSTLGRVAKRPAQKHAPVQPRPRPVIAAPVVPVAKQRPPGNRRCQFPTSDGRPWRFCDAPTASTYCAVHTDLCRARPSGFLSDRSIEKAVKWAFRAA